MRRRCAMGGSFKRRGMRDLGRGLSCVFGVALSLSPMSCSSRGPSSEQTTQVQEDLPEGVVAQVGDEQVRGGTLERVMQAQGVSREEARQLAIRDALFAASAAERLSAEERSVIIRAELGRALYRELAEAALAQGAPTDAEFAELTAERWLELDRPAAARTHHAVVRVDEKTDKAAARALAEKIRAAALGAADGDDFLTRAKAAGENSEGLEVVVQPLSPVAADGRVVDPADPSSNGAMFNVDFAKAANALSEPGQISEPILSTFGYHIIYLVKMEPEQRVPLVERRERLASAVRERRVQQADRALIRAASEKNPVEISRAVDHLTASLLKSQ